MTAQEINDAILRINRANLPIAPGVLEFMKLAAIEKLNNQYVTPCSVCGAPGYYNKGNRVLCHDHRNS